MTIKKTIQIEDKEIFVQGIWGICGEKEEKYIYEVFMTTVVPIKEYYQVNNLYYRLRSQLKNTPIDYLEVSWSNNLYEGKVVDRFNKQVLYIPKIPKSIFGYSKETDIIKLQRKV